MTGALIWYEAKLLEDDSGLQKDGNEDYNEDADEADKPQHAVHPSHTTYSVQPVLSGH
jgi:hypothetical protein